MSLGGANLHSDAFLKKMGRAGLHPFVNGFRSQGVEKMSQLKAMAISEIRQMGSKINMPSPAVDRLLDILGKTGAKKSAPPKKKAKTTKSVSQPKSENKPKSTSTTKSTTDDTKDKSKTEASDYYHFKSTPKDQAAKFNAKKIEDAKQAQWKSADGASSWNPGNTHESRNYSDICRDRLLTILKSKLVYENGIKISKIKTTGSYTIEVSRGKTKYVCDLGFSCKWERYLDGDKISTGKVKVGDIFPDMDQDDWDIEWTDDKKDRNKQYRETTKLISNKFEDISDTIAKLCQAIKEEKCPRPNK
eukprot:UN30355